MNEPRETTKDTAQDPAMFAWGALRDFGAVWAGHGLKAGQLALETSALALTRAARLLSDIAREIEQTGKAAPPVAAEEAKANEPSDPAA